MSSICTSSSRVVARITARPSKLEVVVLVNVQDPCEMSRGNQWNLHLLTGYKFSQKFKIKLHSWDLGIVTQPPKHSRLASLPPCGTVVLPIAAMNPRPPDSEIPLQLCSIYCTYLPCGGFMVNHENVMMAFPEAMKAGKSRKEAGDLAMKATRSKEGHFRVEFAHAIRIKAAAEVPSMKIAIYTKVWNSVLWCFMYFRCFSLFRLF